MRNVLITGGSRGIGAATVRHFRDKGAYNVTFTYCHNKALAESICSESQLGQQVHCFQLDINNINRSELEKQIERQGGFDIIIHNAAYTDDAPFFFLTEDQWSKPITASLDSFYTINQLALKKMIRQKWGRIIVLSSVSGEMGNRGQSNYAAAKGALTAATKSLAIELGRKNILCNIVSPGLVDTEMTKDVPEEINKSIPLGRFGRADEIASAIGFLASDEASYINGTILQVNGGLRT